ncbi:MAG: hypothetical protein AABW50_01105 [Nanoarchaeota archaeon]
MAKCELYQAAKAFYEEEQDVFVCEISRGKCPYNNEGHRLECKDKKIRVICKTNAEVGNKSGLILRVEDFL